MFYNLPLDRNVGVFYNEGPFLSPSLQNQLFTSLTSTDSTFALVQAWASPCLQPQLQRVAKQLPPGQPCITSPSGLFLSHRRADPLVKHRRFCSSLQSVQQTELSPLLITLVMFPLAGYPLLSQPPKHTVMFSCRCLSKSILRELCVL